jgi:hypothetical protein
LRARLASLAHGHDVRALGAIATAELLVVAAVALAYGAGGPAQVAGALALAPVAVACVHLHGLRLAGTRFAYGAAVVYVALPLAAIAYFLPAYRPTYTHDVLPSLLGLEHTAWFALGVAIAAASLVAPARALAAAGVVAAAVALAVWGTGPLGDVKIGLHEGGWSIGFLEWAVVAGVAGAARRAPWRAAFLGGWLVFFVLRAAHRPFGSGAFWTALAPALPAAALLAAAIALLVPQLRPAPAPAGAPRDAP